MHLENTDTGGIQEADYSGTLTGKSLREMSMDSSGFEPEASTMPR